MHFVIEAWSPRKRFLEATPEVRAGVFDGVRQGMTQLAAAGIETLGWGPINREADKSVEYEWFAIWKMPDAQSAATFLEAVKAAGWYDWFDQINISGELAPVDVAIAAHLGLG